MTKKPTLPTFLSCCLHGLGSLFSRYTMSMRIVYLPIFLALFVPVFAQAATVYLDPQEGSYAVGDTFIVNVRVEADGDCINAAHVELSFPADSLKPVDFGKGGSILSLWIDEPVLNAEQGLVSFSGGIPGGYCGRVKGDPALTNTLGKAVFTVIGAPSGRAVVEVTPRTEIYLHDGKGTHAEVKRQPAQFTLTASTTKPVNEWLAEVQQDSIPPDAFTVETQSTRGVFGGSYYLVFSTIDKQSGLDHYDIYEGGGWHPVTSPYKIGGRTLESVRIRAVDKAGNERIGEYDASQAPPLQTGPEAEVYYIGLLAVALLLVLVRIWYYFHKKGLLAHDA